MPVCIPLSLALFLSACLVDYFGHKVHCVGSATVPKTPTTSYLFVLCASSLGDPAQEIVQQPFFASLSARLASPPSALVTLAMSGLPALTRANWIGLLPMAWGRG